MLTRDEVIDHLNEIIYDKRGTAEQWIKEGKQAVNITRLICHRFRSNEVRLCLSVMGAKNRVWTGKAALGEKKLRPCGSRYSVWVYTKPFRKLKIEIPLNCSAGSKNGSCRIFAPSFKKPGVGEELCESRIRLAILQPRQLLF